MPSSPSATRYSTNCRRGPERTPRSPSTRGISSRSCRLSTHGAGNVRSGTADRGSESSGHHTVRVELHDIIISKLGRYHAKDRSDIETYWPDKLEKTDRNFNLVRTVILGLPSEDWEDDYD